MKVCATLPWSCASIGQRRLWFVQWRQINSRATVERRRNDASPIVPESAATLPHPSVDQDNKTIATAVGHLPLSPIMDPSYWEATMRHKTAKPKASKAQNSVERQFRKNPFAKALSTPVRQCTASQKRLPAFFLQDFNLIAHPTTHQPWWVARSLAWEQPATESRPVNDSGDEEFRDEQVHVGADGERSGAQGEGPSVKPPGAIKSKDVRPYGPRAYVLARQDLISAFATKRSGYEHQPRRLFGGSSSRYAKLSGTAVWREDMDSLILHRMRQEIIKDLFYISGLCTEENRSYIVGCHSWDDVKHKPNGSVLWFEDAPILNEVANPDAQPGPFSIYNTNTDSGTNSMALHNIPMLLGAQNAARIRQKPAMFGDASLFMLTGRRTTDLQLKLWRLQGYLADYKRENKNDQPQ